MGSETRRCNFQVGPFCFYHYDILLTTITSNDGKTIYVTAEENGRVKLFKLPASPRHATKLPEALTSNGTVTDKHVLPSGELFLSGNSLIDNSIYSIIDPSKPSEQITVSSSSDEGKAFGLSQNQVDEFWYTGAEDYKVHAWVVKPSNFDKNKKYPLAYLIHGGVSVLISQDMSF